MPKARIWGPWYPEDKKENIAIMCPGCKCHHVIATKEPQSNGAVWGFNQDMEKPTFTPSLLIKTGLYAGAVLVDENDLVNYPEGKKWNEFLKNTSTICHSFIRDGKIQFLSDCTHELKNQTVELPEIDNPQL